MTIQNNQTKTNLRIIIMAIGLMVALLVLTVSNTIAQKNDTLLSRKVQITFAYPLSSNGLNSKAYSNNFSFNCLYGVNGGVNGFELGGIGNYNKGKVEGVQLSGAFNINEGVSKGLMLSGVSNVVKDTVSGVAISGVFNYSAKASRGFQLSTVNINKSDFSGLQLGVVNYSKKLKGVQLGIINIGGDAEKGLPIGLINIVKNGYYAFEATAGGAMDANFNYKMGVERFYTIFKLGYTTYRDNPVYSYGIGFGTNISFAERHKMSIDLSTNAIVYDNNWNDDFNFLNVADFNYKYSLTPKLSLMAGPSFNVYVSEVKVGDQFGTLSTPGTIYSSENDNRKVSMWIGFNAGLAFKL